MRERLYVVFPLNAESYMHTVRSAIIVVTTTARVTVNTYDNFQIVLGTDNVMRWWFIVTMPLCFIMLAGRVVGNMVEDFAKYKAGEPLIKQAVIGGDI